MGFLDSITEFIPSFLTLDAEAAPEKEDAGAEEEEESKDKGEGEGGEETETTEVEEEEEEEPEDPLPGLEEECRESAQCKTYKHEYDECAARVTGQIEEHGKAKEDCVEEFFELAHCATSCAAPKLWKLLK